MGNFKTIGFIGGGRVTRFLLEGLKKAGYTTIKVQVHDPNKTLLEALRNDYNIVEAASNSEAAKADLVLLAVHPPVIKDVLTEIKDSIKPDSVILSLAPKITVSFLQSALGVMQIARMIPNAPSAICKGYNPVAFAEGIEPPIREKLYNIFTTWGNSPEVPENMLEAYAIITAMGPTYFWFQWQTLRELAVKFGLSRTESDIALKSMIFGAAEYFFDSEIAPEKIIDTVPVKPLAEAEGAIKSIYESRLDSLYEKLKNK